MVYYIYIMTEIYSLDDINHIIFCGFNYELPEKTLNIISQLSLQVGSPDYVKTPVFKKCDNVAQSEILQKESYKKKRGNKYKEIVNDSDWNALKNFQTTKIEEKVGVDIKIDAIRTYLNKLSDKNYIDIRNKVMDTIENLKENMDNDDLKNLRTRCGYVPSESIIAFEKNLHETGVVGLGKCLHFAIDLICSGGIHSFFKIIWNYSLNHIGIASVRIFMYLNKRISDLEELIKKYPDETLYNNQEFQTKVCEMILILHDAPKTHKIVWPKVGVETHDSLWFKSVASAPATDIVNKVWKGDGDLRILYFLGNEIVKSASEYSSERVLFWIKWGFEEEAKMKKENNHSTLTTVDRSSTGKGKGEVSYYFLAILSEIYKELSRKSMIRMNEEFQSLIDIFRSSDLKFSLSFRKNLLALIAQIICEVPRWKVPAANPLIKDPVVLTRTLPQCSKFFVEVLQYPSVASQNLNKLFKSKGKIEKKKDNKKLSMEEQFQAFDKAMEEYIKK